jgi:hypothetical protein
MADLKPGDPLPPVEREIPDWSRKESDERLLGRYAEVARLLTSPRFNKPQLEVLEDEVELLRACLEDRGMTAVAK